MLYNDDKTGPFIAAGCSVTMQLWTGEGVQRSLREHADILEGAGFIGVIATPTFGDWSVVSGVKP